MLTQSLRLQGGARHCPNISTMLFVSIAHPVTTRATIVSVTDLALEIIYSCSQISVSSCSFVCYWLGLPTSNFVDFHGRFGLDLERSLRDSTVGSGFVRVAQLCFMVSYPPSLLSSFLYLEFVVCASNFRVAFVYGFNHFKSIVLWVGLWLCLKEESSLSWGFYWIFGSSISHDFLSLSDVATFRVHLYSCSRSYEELWLELFSAYNDCWNDLLVVYDQPFKGLVSSVKDGLLKTSCY
ncbi:hypothetical protein V6N13_014420 [Hibiscus sabdariffa]